MKPVCILGEGAWGTAVATLLANNGYRVKLWCHDPHIAQSIFQTRLNERYLPGIHLDEKIEPVTDFRDALSDVRWIFEAIPIKYLRNVLEQVHPFYNPDHVWVMLSKGIEQDTLLLPSQLIDQIFGSHTHKAVFSGPSFAKEVAHNQITAVTIAASHYSLANELQKLLANSYFRPYVSRDIIGVQVAGALKNVIALGVGLMQGAGYTDNTKAFIITRSLHEMALVSDALGGRHETVFGLSGLGDLVLTTTGSLSKNLQVGIRLGAGQSLDTILQETGYISEGINTVVSVHQLMQEKKLDLPICYGIYRVIIEGLSVEHMLHELMNKPLEQECEL